MNSVRVGAVIRCETDGAREGLPADVRIDMRVQLLTTFERLLAQFTFVLS